VYDAQVEDWWVDIPLCYPSCLSGCPCSRPPGLRVVSRQWPVASQHSSLSLVGMEQVPRLLVVSHSEKDEFRTFRTERRIFQFSRSSPDLHQPSPNTKHPVSTIVSSKLHTHNPFPSCFTTQSRFTQIPSEASAPAQSLS
jgi:hypothetical protein